MKERAVVLLSGGLDSALCLAIAKINNYECYALTFDYGQRHKAEIEAAKNIAKQQDVVEHKIVPLDLSFLSDSALINHDMDLPTEDAPQIPVTYVPGRNVLFLSYALAWADTLKATNIYIGVNALDRSGYPDCRSEFIEAFRDTIDVATKTTTQGKKIRLQTPLIDKSKAQIIKIASAFNIDFANCVSCYSAETVGTACGECDSCRLRQEGFAETELKDKIRYER